MQSINKSNIKYIVSVHNSSKVTSLSNNYDVRLIKVKTGVQCWKRRDGVMVNTSARKARGQWFDSWLWSDRCLCAVFCSFSLLNGISVLIILFQSGQSIM